MRSSHSRRQSSRGLVRFHPRSCETLQDDQDTRHYACDSVAVASSDRRTRAGELAELLQGG